MFGNLQTNGKDVRLNKMSPQGRMTSKTEAEISYHLNSILANEFALFTKTLNYHWNVTGPRFHSIHVFLEEQYRDLLEIMDDVAERVRVIGQYPISTLREFKSEMNLEEAASSMLSSNEMLVDLFESHLKVQDQLKEILETKLLDQDPGTEDFLTALLVKHENMSWMLQSHQKN